MTPPVELSLLILIAVCGTALVTVMVQPRRIYEYPFFMPIGFGVFMLPQVISLYMSPGLIVGGLDSLSWFCLLATLCLIAAAGGYYALPSNVQIRLLTRPLDDRTCLWFAVGLVSIGVVTNLLLRNMTITADQKDRHGNMTGLPVVYHFFAGLVFPGLALAFSLALKAGRRNLLAWVLTAVGLVPPLMNIFLSGRRFSASFTIVLIGMVLFFRKGVIPARWIIISVLFAGLVVLPTVGLVRGNFAENSFDAYTEYDPVGMFGEQFGNARQPEALYACSVINRGQAINELGYGTGHWNHIVFRLVPAQLVSREVKDGLLFPTNSTVDRCFDHPPGVYPGTVMTGIADVFVEFGYFGVAFYFCLGLFFRYLWNTSISGQNIGIQAMYCALSTEAARMVLFQTIDFLPALLTHTILWFVALQLFATRQFVDQ